MAYCLTQNKIVFLSLAFYPLKVQNLNGADLLLEVVEEPHKVPAASTPPVQTIVYAFLSGLHIHNEESATDLVAELDLSHPT